MSAPARHGERGMALVAVLMLSLLVLGLSAACLAPLASGLREVSERAARARAHYLARGAVARAHASLEKVATPVAVPTAPGGAQLAAFDAALDPTGEVLTAADGSTATITRQLDGTFLIVGTATTDGATATVHEVLQAVPGTPFTRAVFADATIDARAAIFTDGYDSALGTYLSQRTQTFAPTGRLHAPGAGTLAANGSISLASGEVHGSVTPGPGGGLELGMTHVTGTTPPAPALHALTPVEVIPPPTNDNLSLAPRNFHNGHYAIDTGSATIAAGTYDIASFSVTGDATVSIAGDVTIHVSEAFRTGFFGRVVLKSGATLRIRASEDAAVTMWGLGISNPSGIPERLIVEAATDPVDAAAPALRIDTFHPFQGAIYAPGRDLASAFGIRLYGAAVVKSLSLGGPSEIHYDAALARSTALAGPIRYEVIAAW